MSESVCEYYKKLVSHSVEYCEILSHEICAKLFKFLRENNTLKVLFSKMASANSILDQVGANLRKFDQCGLIEEGLNY